MLPEEQHESPATLLSYLVFILVLYGSGVEGCSVSWAEASKSHPQAGRVCHILEDEESAHIRDILLRPIWLMQVSFCRDSESDDSDHQRNG